MVILLYHGIIMVPSRNLRLLNRIIGMECVILTVCVVEFSLIGVKGEVVYQETRPEK